MKKRYNDGLKCGGDPVIDEMLIAPLAPPRWEFGAGEIVLGGYKITLRAAELVITISPARLASARSEFEFKYKRCCKCGTPLMGDRFCVTCGE